MIESSPRPGSIGLTSIVGPVGLGIRVGQWLLGSRWAVDGYEHAFVVLDGDRLIEAQPGGARIVPLSTYADRRVLYVAPAGLTDEQRARICAEAVKYVRVGYSFADYAAIAAHRFHLPIPGLRRYVESSKHLICSALVDKAYQDAGIQLFDDGRWNGWVTPADIAVELGREGV